MGYQTTIDEVEGVLNSQNLAPEALYVQLHRWSRKSLLRDALNAMVFAESLYEQLTGATVSLEVLTIPLASTEWVQRFHLVTLDCQQCSLVWPCLNRDDSSLALDCAVLHYKIR